MIQFILLTMLPFAYCTLGGVDFCVFDGKKYEVGAVLDENHCFQMTCTATREVAVWVPSNETKCTRCRVCNDPHFVTFDSTSYDFHGTCNYTLTQQIKKLSPGNEETYNPDYAVFSKFDACYGSPSCLGTTTFKNDPNTLIVTNPTMNPLTYTVNGPAPCSPITPQATVVCSQPGNVLHPVITWQYNNCRRFQGTHFAVEYCWGCVRIYANYNQHNFNEYGLNGLCGLFNLDSSDDLTKRDNTPATSIADHAISWKTNMQPRECDDTRAPWYCPEYDEYVELCENAISQGILTNEEYDVIIDNCARDICADKEDPKKWLNFHTGVVKKEIDIKENNPERGCIYREKMYDVGYIMIKRRGCMQCQETKTGTFQWVKVKCPTSKLQILRE